MLVTKPFPDKVNVCGKGQDPTRVGHLSYSLPGNITQGCKGLPRTSSLEYYEYS